MGTACTATNPPMQGHGDIFHCEKGSHVWARRQFALGKRLLHLSMGQFALRKSLLYVSMGTVCTAKRPLYMGMGTLCTAK